MIQLCPELIAYCTAGSVKDIVRLSSVSRLFYQIINSEPFFNALLQIAEETQFRPASNSFKERFFEMRSFYSIEEFEHAPAQIHQQKVIFKDHLFVAMQVDQLLTLKILDIKNPKKRQIPCIFECSSSCLGKEYLILSSQKRTTAHPLFNLSSPIEFAASEDTRYVFAREDDFIEVIFSAEKLVFDILNVHIGKDIQRTPIKKGITPSKHEKATILDACFHRDRLMIAFKANEEIELLSYDLLTKIMIKFPSIPSDNQSHAQFTYLDHQIGFSYKDRLTTFTFGKL